MRRSHFGIEISRRRPWSSWRPLAIAAAMHFLFVADCQSTKGQSLAADFVADSNVAHHSHPTNPAAADPWPLSRMPAQRTNAEGDHAAHRTTDVAPTAHALLTGPDATVFRKPRQDAIALPGRPSQGAKPTGFAADANVPMVAKALGLVVGPFLGLLWMIRRLRLGHRDGEDSVFQVLGHFVLFPRRRAYIVSFASRLLVLTDAPGGVEKITEVTDRAEVARITEMCATLGGAQLGESLHGWMTARQLMQVAESESRRHSA